MQMLIEGGFKYPFKIIQPRSEKLIIIFLLLVTLGFSIEKPLFAGTTSHSLSYSTDGSLLAVANGGADYTINSAVRIFNPATGDLIRTIKLGQSIWGQSYVDVTKVAFSADGSTLLTHTVGYIGELGDTGQVCSWSVQSGQKIKCHNTGGFGLALADNNQVWLNSYWDLSMYSTPALGKLQGTNNFALRRGFQMDYHQGKLLITGNHTEGNRKLGDTFDWLIYDSNNGQWQAYGQFKDAPFYTAIWSNNGQFVVTGHENGTVRIWLENGDLLQTINTGYSGYAEPIFSPNDDLIVGDQKTGSVVVYRSSGSQINYSEYNRYNQNCTPLQSFVARFTGTIAKPENAPGRFAVSPNGAELAIGCDNHYQTVQLSGRQPEALPPQVSITSPLPGQVLNTGVNPPTTTIVDDHGGNEATLRQWTSSPSHKGGVF